MENSNQPENFGPQPDASSIAESQEFGETPKKSRKKIWIIGIVSVLLGFCSCTGLCAFFGISGTYEVYTQKDDVAKVIDDFMLAMAKEDTDEAYSLFSARSKQKRVTIPALEEMIFEANYSLFDGYEEIEIVNLQLKSGSNTNPDVAQGKLAIVDGIVVYNNDYRGKFAATLEREGEDWYLDSIHINVPPNKMKDYLEKEP